MRHVSIVLLVLLSGCAGTASSVRPPFCDWLKHYSADLQQAAADELERNDVPVLRGLVDDYGELRARMRGACR